MFLEEDREAGFNWETHAGHTAKLALQSNRFKPLAWNSGFRRRTVHGSRDARSAIPLNVLSIAQWSSLFAANLKRFLTVQRAFVRWFVWWFVWWFAWWFCLMLVQPAKVFQSKKVFSLKSDQSLRYSKAVTQSSRCCTHQLHQYFAVCRTRWADNVKLLCFF